MYTNHRSLSNTIRKLRQQAQALLEEADILMGRDFILQQEIKTHISHITKAELRKRLRKPTLFCFKEMPIPPPQPQASTSSLNLSAQRHCIRYMRSGEPMRCYECNSLSHINGTATYTSVHCVDKDSLDMPKRTVLTITTMMELEDSSISGERKPVTITENVKTPTSFTYLFQNQMV